MTEVVLKNCCTEKRLTNKRQLLLLNRHWFLVY